MARTRNDYIPRPDGDFAAFADNYAAALELFWEAQGLDTNDLKPLGEALAAWQEAYPAHIAAQAAAESTRQVKDAARTGLERAIRPITSFVQSYPGTTDADRAEIGITVREGTRTPSSTPTTRPRITVSTDTRLSHTLRLADEDLTNLGDGSIRRTRKPDGVMGAQLWMKLVTTGDPLPLDPQTYTFVQMVTKPVIRTEFQQADGGKTAAYMLRWVSTRGEVGPWSEVATGTVAA